MKTLNQIILSTCFALWVLTSITACRTKNLSTQSSRMSNRHAEDISIHDVKRDSLQSSRVIELRDSVNKQYSVKIFPVDTFSFSIKGGYKGKARMIEISGIDQQVRNISDSSTSKLNLQKETQYDGQSRGGETSETLNKKLEKRSSQVTGILLVLGGIGVVLWLMWVFRRTSIRF